MGILGTGSIGSAIAAAASGMGIQVVGLSRSGRDHPAFHRVYPAAERLAFAEGLDHLVAVLPATPATSGFVDAGLLARLTPGATFINVGRGSTVDLEAVIAALNARRLSLAVLDVLEEEPLPDGDPLWLVPGLVITSHTAATSVPSDIVRLFAANLERFRTGGSLRGAVDPDAGY